MKRSQLWPSLAAVAVLAAACAEESPVSSNGDRLVIEPRTVELVLPWSVFGEGVEVYGGFGSPDDLANSVIALDYEGGLDARALVGFGPYPDRTTVRDSVGENVVDSTLTFVGGRVVITMDTLASTAEGPVDLEVLRMSEDWHSPTATWDFAVDTIGDRREWSVAGGGAVELLSAGTWDPMEADSVVFELDSIQIAQLGDTAAVTRSIRIDLLTGGERVEMSNVRLRLDTRPSVNPDSTFVLTTTVPARTFIYQPQAPPPPDGIRIGGAPAWRSVIAFDLPKTLTGPAEVCARVSCPFSLDPSRINTASLMLTTRTVEPAAFQPSDTVRLDARPVLAPERLPKSPLGGSFLGVLGRPVDSDAFGEADAVEVGIPITSFIRTILAEEEPPTRELALLSILEPLSIAYGTFDGPGSDTEPRLRLIVTVADTVEVR